MTRSRDLANLADGDFAGTWTVDGLTVDGDVTLTGASYNVVWDKSDNALEFGDNAKAIFGAGSDLTIYHDGSRSIIQDNGTGNLRIQANNLELNNADNSENYIFAAADGAVQLYYDNASKLATTSTGVTVTGNGRFDNTATTPVRLHINNSGSNDYASIYADTASAYKNLIINPDGGNVGIGTGSPNNKLDVNGGIVCSPNTDGKDTFELSTSAVNEARLRMKNVDTINIEIRAGGDSYFKGGKFSIGTDTADTGTLLTVAGAGSFTGQNTAHGASRIKIGQDTTAISQIRFYGADTSTAGILQFTGSSSDGSVGAERMRIDSSGNLQLSNGGSFLVKDRGSILVYNTNDDNYARIQNTSASGNELQFSTNALAMTIDISGRVGIANDTPGDFATSADDLVIGNSTGGRGITIRSGTTSSGNLFFADGTTGNELYRGYVQYNHTADLLNLGVAGDTRIVIDSSGDVQIGTLNGSAGATDNFKRMTAGHFTTKNGVTAIASTGVATTLVTFGSNEGNFIVSAMGSGTGNIEDNTTAIVHINNTASKITTLLAGSRVVLSMSGLNLQVTQSIFGSANITWSVMRIR
jgi:hypothetical protein